MNPYKKYKKLEPININKVRSLIHLLTKDGDISIPEDLCSDNSDNEIVKMEPLRIGDVRELISLSMDEKEIVVENCVTLHNKNRNICKMPDVTVDTCLRKIASDPHQFRLIPIQTTEIAVLAVSQVFENHQYVKVKDGKYWQLLFSELDAGYHVKFQPDFANLSKTDPIAYGFVMKYSPSNVDKRAANCTRRTTRCGKMLVGYYENSDIIFNYIF